MPAPPLQNTFNGGTVGTTISTVNSGGLSGNAFTRVDGAPTFSNIEERDGLSMRSVDAAANERVFWEALGSITTSVYFRVYLWLSRIPVTGDQLFASTYTSAFANNAYLDINNGTGFMGARNAAGSAIAAAEGNVVVPIGAWFRVEGRMLASVTAGEVEWKWWREPESTGTPDNTDLVTGQVLGANIDKIAFGSMDIFPATPHTFYMENPFVSTVGWIGPAGLPLRFDYSQFPKALMRPPASVRW